MLTLGQYLRPSNCGPHQFAQWQHISFFLFLKFIWLSWVFVVACGISFPAWGLNLSPLYWEHRILTTGPPGKSQHLYFLAFPKTKKKLSSSNSIETKHFVSLKKYFRNNRTNESKMTEAEELRYLQLLLQPRRKSILYSAARGSLCFSFLAKFHICISIFFFFAFKDWNSQNIKSTM